MLIHSVYSLSGILKLDMKGWLMILSREMRFFGSRFKIYPISILAS